MSQHTTSTTTQSNDRDEQSRTTSTTTQTTQSQREQSQTGNPDVHPGIRKGGPTTDTTTVAAEASVQSVTEKRGEVRADRGANAKILGEEGETDDERKEAARAEALSNHAFEHANDNEELAKQDGRR